MKNNFSLAFGVVFILIGILNIFFKIDSLVIVGLTTSAFIFSIIDLFEKRLSNHKIFNTCIYILALLILIACMSFSESLIKIKWIYEIANSKWSNVISFFSFGSIFIASQFKQHELIKEKKDAEKKLTNSAFEIITNTYITLIEEMNNISNENYSNSSIKILETMGEYLNEYDLINSIKNDLINANSSKNEYTLEEIEYAFKKNSNMFKKLEEKKKNVSNEINHNKKQKIASK